MTQLRISEVDERDSSWEDAGPVFRVYLQAGGPTETGGATATYDISGADVLQVIDWAQRRAGTAHTYSVALVRDDFERASRGHAPRGLVWLVGVDGNDRDLDEPGPERQRRMLARRLDPVVVPEADRMPEA